MDERPPLSATDLLAFTSRDRHSSHLSVPFVLGGHTYGCNGHMAARIPGRHVDTDGAKEVEALAGMFETAAARAFVPFEPVIAETRPGDFCRECRGAGRVVDCELCEGTGEHQCGDDWCGCAHECGACDGRGGTPARRGEPGAHACEACDGTGRQIDKSGVYLGGGLALQWRYLCAVQALPGPVEWSVPEPETTHFTACSYGAVAFRGPGWEAIILPIRTSGNEAITALRHEHSERAQRAGPLPTPAHLDPGNNAMTTAAASVSLARPASGLGIAEYMTNASTWSVRTFGPGPRTLGVVAHIRKEIEKIENEPADLAEWADLVILALDGCWRAMIDWDDPSDVPGRREWYAVEDDLLDLLFCQTDERDTIHWPDFDPIHELLAEIDGVVTGDDKGGARQSRPIDFLFRLIALKGLLLACGLGAQYSELREAIFAKLERNMARQWPDWRTASPDKLRTAPEQQALLTIVCDGAAALMSALAVVKGGRH